MPYFNASDGTRLFYQDDGKGDPVLCLAGLTRNSADFTYLAPHLAAKRLIRMDYRGRGKSDYPDDIMTYNILREGQDALELLDHLGLADVALVGTSRGGLIAMALSVTHLGRLNRVILNDIGPEIAPAGLNRIMEYVGQPPRFKNLDAAAQALLKDHAEGFPGVPLARWRMQAEFMWEDLPQGGVGLRYDARLREALIGQAGAGPAPDLWPLFDGLARRPVAVIRGQNSDLLTPETLAKMQDRHPNLVTAIVPNRGHVPFLDEPEALAAIHRILDAHP